MFTRESFRHEAHFVIDLTTRDRAKRLAVILLAAEICWFAGARGGVLPALALSLLAEAAAAVVARLRPPPEEDPSARLAAAMCVVHVLIVTFALLPAGILMSRAELPWVLSGFTLLFGVYAYVSTKHAALPIHNSLAMGTAFAAGGACLVRAALLHGAREAPGPWIVMGGLFAAYCACTVQTMRDQKDFRRELSAARAVAQARLLELEHLTRHDPLTDLLNRRAFDERLGALLADPAGPGVAAFLIDLDDFKPINDTHSHAAGDAVLVAVAGRLAALAGPEGLAARLGGDEFALAIPGLAGEAAALDLAHRIMREIERPVAFEEKELRVGGSVGVSLGGGSAGGGVGALMAQADRAMYRAKAARQAGGERRAVLHAPPSGSRGPSSAEGRDLLRVGAATAS